MSHDKRIQLIHSTLAKHEEHKREVLFGALSRRLGRDVKQSDLDRKSVV